MPGVRAVRRLAVAAAVGSGSLATHALVYRALAGSGAGGGVAHQHHDHAHAHDVAPLVDHGYLEPAAAAAALLLVGSLVLAAVRRRRGASDALAGDRRLGRVVATGSILGFAVTEIGERLVAGAPLHDLAAILGLGLPAVAAVSVAQLALLRRAVRLVSAQAIWTRPVWFFVPPAAEALRPAPVAAPSSRPSRAIRSRAPPSVAPVLI